MNYTCQFCETQTHEKNTNENSHSLILSREKWCKQCGKTTFHFATRDKDIPALMKFGQEVKPKELRS